jgi:putative membrane protein
MKSLLRSIIINLAALQSAVLLIPGITNAGGVKTLVWAIVVLAIMNLLVRPIISLLLLPINLLTLGAFRWLINVAVLFLLTLIVTELKVKGFTFNGFEYHGFIIPTIQISKFWTLVLASATISVTNSFLFWLATDS